VLNNGRSAGGEGREQWREEWWRKGGGLDQGELY